MPWYHLDSRQYSRFLTKAIRLCRVPILGPEKTTTLDAITGVPEYGSIFTVPAPRPCSVVSCLPLLTNRGSLKTIRDVLCSSPLLSIVMVIIAANNRFCQQQFRFFHFLTDRYRYPVLCCHPERNEVKSKDPFSFGYGFFGSLTLAQNDTVFVSA